MSKVLVFIAGRSPDGTEATLIAGLTSAGFTVGVRSKKAAAGANYGSVAEECDFVAAKSGVAIPASHSAKTNIGAKPAQLIAWPAAKTLSLAGVNTVQLLILSLALGAAEYTDVTATATYVSSVPGKATVSVGGLVTGVAAGTTTITVTYTDANGATITDTVAITVTA